MKIISGHPSFPVARHPSTPISYRKIPCVATIGVFDGIHRGHAFILKKVTTQAKRHGIRSLVISFDIPPQLFLKKRFDGCISTLGEKESLLAAQGIDYAWFLTTTTHLLKLSAEEFLKYILKYFTITTLFVGEGFKFGRNGEAGIETLKGLSRKYHFKVVVVRKRRWKRKIISSSLIREYIVRAQFTQVKKFLGRNYVLEGNVVAGKGIGEKLGFPTANLKVINCVIPREGVYAAVAFVGGRAKLAAINIGTNPTITKSHKLFVEAHLIDFNGDIAGKNLKILFLQRLRQEKKFPSRELLRGAIRKDINIITKKYQSLSSFAKVCLRQGFGKISPKLYA